MPNQPSTPRSRNLDVGAKYVTDMKTKTTPMSQYERRKWGIRTPTLAKLGGPKVAQNPNAMAMGTQFATQNYGTQMQGAMSAYNTQVSNTSNPWMEALGMVTGVVAQGAGGWAMGRAMRPPAPTKV